MGMIQINGGADMEQNQLPFVTLDEAKNYVIKKIVDKSIMTNISLDDLEVKMLYWTAEKEDLELNTEFNKIHTQDELESKVVKLIRAIVENSIRERAIFRRANYIIGKRDHYITIMLKEGMGSSGNNVPPESIILVILMFASFLWGLTGMDYVVGNPFAPSEKAPESTRLMWWPFVVLSLIQIISLIHVSFMTSIKGWRIDDEGLFKDLGSKHPKAIKKAILSLAIFQPVLGVYLMFSGIFEKAFMNKKLIIHTPVEYTVIVYVALFIGYWLAYKSIRRSNKERENSGKN